MTVNATVENVLTKHIHLGQYLPAKQCNNNLQRALLVLTVVKKELGIDGLSAPEITTILQKKFSVKRITNQAIRGALNSDDGNYVNTTVNERGVKIYHITKKAEKEFLVEKNVIDEDFEDADVLLPPALFAKTKKYIQDIVLEINGCYRDRYFTACTVMLRRLFETLIIEAYESKGIEEEIKNDGEYVSLERLIGKCVNQPKIKLSKGTKNQLPKLKLFGDHGAHNRKYIGRKTDISKNSAEIRIAAEELAGEII